MELLVAPFKLTIFTLIIMIGLIIVNQKANAGAAIDPKQSVLPCDKNLKVKPKVVGGRPAPLAKWPWIVSLQFFDDEDKVTLASCGGTVIAKNWVLTAAHCLRDIDIKTFSRSFIGQEYFGKLQAVIGISDLRLASKENRYPIEKIIIHPNYLNAEKAYKQEHIEFERKQNEGIKNISPPLSPSKTIGNDIALIKLSRSWEGDIAPISLDRKFDTDGSYQANVAGFGAVELKNTNNSIDPVLRKYELPKKHKLFAGCARLMQATLPTVTLKECRRKWMNSKQKGIKIDESNICAGFVSPSKDSCSGDSGSALVTEDKNGDFYQIGIVSWGTRNCAGEQSSYGVYTRVSHFANWIIGAISEHKSALKSKSALNIQKTAIKKPTNQIPELIKDLKKILGTVDGNIKITIKDSPIIKLGQTFKFQIESNTAGKLLLIDVGPHNSILQIFPNEYTVNENQMEITPASVIIIPNEEDKNKIQFFGSLPIGKGKVIALVVPKDFPINLTLLKEVSRQKTKGLSNIDTPYDYIINLVMEIYDEVRKSEKLGINLTKTWAYGEINYEVIDPKRR